ncbi:RNA polymerase sigma-70 factor (ECF subfamily) [Rhodococcus sp. SMB37]|uniref:RNA polymerase sigma factor n=1 Tax=Rhodococcus sp. SMB37 TaxID=2512213 RepID=UPI0006D0BD2F|nr:sigma-70 family RNA polymerase sigma factor [Rhodococcus sp. SMB37]TCN52671.1 RNA polymerase sigma-70 factor (ECF subfamily) [Rhodococcus sp. SMB37]
MNDDELIEQCRAGDTAAFGELVGAYRTRTWAVCLQITGNRHDAEDALQDALTAAWQNLDKFRGTAKFSTWLHRIAANAALATVRRRREVMVDEIDLGASSEPTVADRVVDVDAVRRALADLPDEYRTAVVLREYAQLSYAEIAEHQGIPVQTVKSRINRARTRLVEALAPAV